MLPRVPARGAEFHGGPPPFVTAQRVLRQAAEFDGNPDDFKLRWRIRRRPAEFRGASPISAASRRDSGLLAEIQDIPQGFRTSRRDSGHPAGFSYIPQKRVTRRRRPRWSTKKEEGPEYIPVPPVHIEVNGFSIRRPPSCRPLWRSSVNSLVHPASRADRMMSPSQNET